eukprot:TRINITY_DN6370_c0_g1_i1.p1 TRINITY_DN6370_c0_g1~~TRINITY_DN6370_c0_g1_i1.p1  ORF type:complete len:180 (+),score=22.81 TRINITY_DN6370_c0_g1_i1:43-582(+)
MEAAPPEGFAGFLAECRRAVTNNTLDEDIVDEVAPAIREVIQPGSDCSRWLLGLDANDGGNGSLLTRCVHQEAGLYVYLVRLAPRSSYPPRQIDAWGVIGIVTGKERHLLYTRQGPNQAEREEGAEIEDGLQEASARVFMHTFDRPVMRLLCGDISNNFNVEDDQWSVALHVYGSPAFS